MTLTDLDRKLLEEFSEEIGSPSGAVAQRLGISTATVTRGAKKLEAEGLLVDTGYAMKFVQRVGKTGSWQYIDKPKTEGGMVTKPGASTVWLTTPAGHAAIGTKPSPHTEWPAGIVESRSTSMGNRKPKDTASQAEAAGEQYASYQINDEYFMNWVHDQLLEASKMDPSKVLPLETKADALKIAGNMLKQLEWDTKRDLHESNLAHLIGTDVTKATHTAFYEGFRKTCDGSRDWLADELLEIKQGMRSPQAHEARRVLEASRKGTSKPWFGKGEMNWTYGIKIDGIENDFPLKPLGRQEEWPAVKAFQTSARTDWIRAKHATSGIAALKRWIKAVNPSQFYTRFDEGDDSFQVWYTGGNIDTVAESGSGVAREAHRPEPVDDPFYIIQGLYNGPDAYSAGDSFGYEEEDVAIAEAQKLARSPYFEGDYVRIITRDGELVWDSREGRASQSYLGAARAEKQATRPGKHGTLRLWRIVYKDSNNAAFGEDSFRKWAYDKQAAWDDFNEQTDSEGESWEIVKIEPVADTGPTRLSRESTARPKARRSARRASA